MNFFCDVLKYSSVYSYWNKNKWKIMLYSGLDCQSKNTGWNVYSPICHLATKFNDIPYLYTVSQVNNKVRNGEIVFTSNRYPNTKHNRVPIVISCELFLWCPEIFIGVFILKKKWKQCFIMDLIAKAKILAEIFTRLFVILQPNLINVYMYNETFNAWTHCILCMDIINSFFL